MALQGTIESFAVADVVRLLGGSVKTGRLIVTGDRGTALLWFSGGLIVGGSTTSGDTADPVEVVFDMLRYDTGSFVFESDRTCPDPGEPRDANLTLTEAEAAVGEWLDVVAVAHGLEAVVELAPELPHPEVVVDQAVWTSIVAVGGGCTVGALGRNLGLGELPVCRLVRALAEGGFVVVTPTDGAPSVEATPSTIERNPVFSAEPEAPSLPPFRDADPFHTPVESTYDTPLMPMEAADGELPPVPVPSGSWEGPGDVADSDSSIRESTSGAIPEDPFGEFDPFGTASSHSGVTFELGPDEVTTEAEHGSPATTMFTDEAFRAADSGSLAEALPPVPDDEELARQLSGLSPKAAQAISAADSGESGSDQDSPFGSF